LVRQRSPGRIASTRVVYIRAGGALSPAVGRIQPRSVSANQRRRIRAGQTMGPLIPTSPAPRAQNRANDLTAKSHKSNAIRRENTSQTARNPIIKLGAVQNGDTFENFFTWLWRRSRWGTSAAAPKGWSQTTRPRRNRHGRRERHREVRSARIGTAHRHDRVFTPARRESLRRFH